MSEHIVFGTRASICPVCQRVISADLVQDAGGLHLEKTCPAHGSSRTRVARDHAWFERAAAFSARSVRSPARQTAAAKGCPEDCGECPEHRQAGALFLFELTDACDLRCPICLGQPQDRGTFVTPEQMRTMAQQVVAYAGTGAIVTLGGGEPTAHPRFFELVGILHDVGIRDVWVYTNGRRIARDPEFARRCAGLGLTVVLQWDGFSDGIYETLRGRPLLEEKQLALERLREAGGALGLCASVAAGVNDGELGALFRAFVDDPAVGFLDLAPLAFVGLGAGVAFGREGRVTTQDVVEGLAAQTGGALRPGDFLPVSFPHVECLQAMYLLAHPDGSWVPLARLLDAEDREALLRHTPLLALDARTERVLRDAITKLWASDDPEARRGVAVFRHLVERLFPAEALAPAEFQARSRRLVKLVWIHSYMDALNFDLGRARMCVSRTVLPDGRLVPSCAYNVVHRGRGAQGA